MPTRRDATPAIDRIEEPSGDHPGLAPPAPPAAPGCGADAAFPAAEGNGSAKRRLRGCPDRLHGALAGASDFTGALLRRLRQAAEAPLEAVAAITKVQLRYLRALEEDDHATLPAPVYVRGFIAEYARALGLDGRQAADSYMRHYRALRQEP